MTRAILPPLFCRLSSFTIIIISKCSLVYMLHAFFVSLCIGRFFEWQTSGRSKQPYFMSFAESDALLSDEELAAAQDHADLLNAQEVCDLVEEQSQDVSSGKAEEDRVKFAGRSPKRLLTMAGLFDIWHPLPVS